MDQDVQNTRRLVALILVAILLVFGLAAYFVLEHGPDDERDNPQAATVTQPERVGDYVEVQRPTDLAGVGGWNCFTDGTPGCANSSYDPAPSAFDGRNCIVHQGDTTHVMCQDGKVFEKISDNVRKLLAQPNVTASPLPGPTTARTFGLRRVAGLMEVPDLPGPSDDNCWALGAPECIHRHATIAPGFPANESCVTVDYSLDRVMCRDGKSFMRESASVITPGS